MASGIDSAKFYADFGALTSMNRQVKLKDPQAIRAAAQQFESLFTEMMLKSMRAAKLGDDLGESQESDMYQDMYDQQLAMQMSQGKGLGLADMLVRQLTRRGEVAGSTAGGATGNSATQNKAPATGAVGSLTRAGAATALKPLRPLNGGAHSYALPLNKQGLPSVRSTPGGNSPKSAGAASLSERISFVQKLEPYAQQAASALGVSADTLIAQAALETGWGRHLASGTGSGSSNNMFGIKSGADWQGATATATTTEYAGDSVARVAQPFRHYPSVQQGVEDYVSLLQKRTAYRGALGTGSDAGAFAGALARGGYATDPHYAHKLVATTASVRSLRTLVASMKPGSAPGTSGGSASALPPGTTSPVSRDATFKLLAGMPISDGEDPA